MENNERLRLIRDAVYIEPDEVVLWTGKPAVFRLIRRQIMRELKQDDVNFGCAFFLMLGAVVLLARNPFAGLENIVISTIAIPLPLILLLILIISSLAYFGYKYHRASGIIYAITSRRVLVIEPTANEKQVFAFNDVSKLERRNLPNGSGDLVFDYEMYTMRGKGGRLKKYWREIGFIGIANVAQVAELLGVTFPNNK